MSRVRVAPIVEGHGEDLAVRTLVQRIWHEIVGGQYVDVLKPIRRPRSKLSQKEELGKAVDLAVRKLRAASTPIDPALVLVLVDRDPDAEPPCLLGPRLLGYAREARSDARIACVVANIEYETWFAAAAESLGSHLNLDPRETVCEDPEERRLGKSWVQQRFRGPKYSETIDQPAMTARMDLNLCRKRSPSFDKLCRELEEYYVVSGQDAS